MTVPGVKLFVAVTFLAAVGTSSVVEWAALSCGATVLYGEP